MCVRKIMYPVLLLFVSLNAGAQINIYLGGNLQGNYSWIRGDESVLKPGFGGGFSFVYWEYEYWFIKAGLDYVFKSASCLNYPGDYGVPVDDPDDKIRISYNEQNLGIPLTLYFRPYEQGEHSLLLTATLEMMFVTHLKENSAEYGELVLRGSEVKTRTKTNVGLGAGYQRQLDRHTYLNIYPSLNIDLRSVRPFQTINLTAELIFGVY
ncbi:MAG TPA: hypothetical protein ENO20_02845 [Bacteroides sp.]|nr:hypothetical protein [Bacteroides sp.]